ncbi:MAG: flagellar hook-length control protein FliK [Candidatus Marinimicrobia bacterium]|nr:flagellar hook-length control protein FliK [Candidatus Neomarinimicrobiota bacterium]
MKQSTQILKILDILSTSSKGLGVKKSSLNKKGEQEFESLLTDTDDKLYSVNSSGIILENPPSKAKNILNLPFSNTSPDNSEIIIGEAKISAQENLKVGVIKSTQKSDIISPQNGTRSKLNSLNFASNQRKNTEPIKVSKGKSNLVNSKRLILNKDSAKELIVGLQKDDKQKIVNDLKMKTKLSAGASKAVSNKEGSVVPIDSMKKVIAATGGMKAGEKNEEVVDVNPLIKSGKSAAIDRGHRTVIMDSSENTSSRIENGKVETSLQGNHTKSISKIKLSPVINLDKGVTPKTGNPGGTPVTDIGDGPPIEENENQAQSKSSISNHKLKLEGDVKGAKISVPDVVPVSEKAVKTVSSPGVQIDDGDEERAMSILNKKLYNPRHALSNFREDNALFIPGVRKSAISSLESLSAISINKQLSDFQSTGKRLNTKFRTKGKPLSKLGLKRKVSLKQSSLINQKVLQNSYLARNESPGSADGKSILINVENNSVTSLPVESEVREFSLPKLNTTFTKNGVSVTHTNLPESDPMKFSIKALNEELNKIQLRLSPKGLGNITIDIHQTGKSLYTKIYVESAEVMRILQDSLPELKENLSQQGLNLEEANISARRDEGHHQRSLMNGERFKEDRQDKNSGSAQPPETEVPLEVLGRNQVRATSPYSTVEYLV